MVYVYHFSLVCWGFGQFLLAKTKLPHKFLNQILQVLITESLKLNDIALDLVYDV